ncbi:SRPBCC family protein [Acidithrix sp. C25]|uniref:SRPBCC family protein n=1 Tax=Acidithrix sp. C25 TaxID=1671482 RepID=UPI00191BABCA|nr:SRPBCC family protein [Acidithrix sp. C25]CAG4921665.1 unnamed protein product [Acidithrix sp. C25]
MKNRVISESIEVNTSASNVFDLLAQPKKHSSFDGSNSVKGNISGPDRLYLGAKFSMSMKLGIPYRITNEVVEFEEGRVIAWRHWGHHIWRYELLELDASRCRVTETFDYRNARSPKMLELTKAPKTNQRSIIATLNRIAKLYS